MDDRLQKLIQDAPTHPVNTLYLVHESLSNLDFKDAEKIEDKLRFIATTTNQTVKYVFSLVRLAITGAWESPPLPASMVILGKEKSLGRIAAFGQELEAAMFTKEMAGK